METFSPEVPYPRAMKRFPVLRQSWLASFDACALTSSFELQLRKGWSTSYQARGTMFHRFAARALREMAMHGENTIEVDVALAILHEVLRQEDVDRQCPDCFGRNILPGLSRYGQRTCGDCKAKFETELVNLPMAEVKDLYWTVKKWSTDNWWDVQHLHSTEERFRAPVCYGHLGQVERVLTGRTDAVFVEGDHATVLDWKDTWGLPAPTEVSFKGYFQQRVYAFLLLKQPEFRNVDHVTLREFYVRRSEPREATIWRDDLDAIGHELGALVERFDRAYEEQVFVPTPGSHCGFCLRPSKCPIPVFVRGTGRITTPERASQVAGSLMVAKKVVQDNSEAVSAYADLHGPVPIKGTKGDLAMGHVEKVRTTRPTKDELERAIAAAGPDRIDLEKLYMSKKGTRFGTFKPDPAQSPAARDAALLADLEASLRTKAG